MKIHHSALSGAKRKATLEVVVSANSEALGFGRIAARALPQLHFDLLWGGIVVAEKAEADAKEKGPLQEAKAAQERRQAEEKVVRAMVVDHDAGTFSVELHEDTEDLRTALREAGFTEGEMAEGFKAGAVSKKFVTGAVEVEGVPYAGASEETAQFYRSCQPFGMFFANLLVALHAFQYGAIATPGQVWGRAKVKERAPIPFPKAQG